MGESGAACAKKGLLLPFCWQPVLAARRKGALAAPLDDGRAYYDVRLAFSSSLYAGIYQVLAAIYATVWRLLPLPARISFGSSFFSRGAYLAEKRAARRRACLDRPFWATITRALSLLGSSAFLCSNPASVPRPRAAAWTTFSPLLLPSLPDSTCCPAALAFVSHCAAWEADNTGLSLHARQRVCYLYVPCLPFSAFCGLCCLQKGGTLAQWAEIRGVRRCLLFVTGAADQGGARCRKSASRWPSLRQTHVSGRVF
jgi:hypothetical protein